MLAERQPMVLEYVVDLDRPFVRRRQWRFGVLTLRPPGQEALEFAVTGKAKREVKAKARAIRRTHRSPPATLALLEALEPVTKGPMHGLRELRCLTPGCGHVMMAKPRMPLTARLSLVCPDCGLGGLWTMAGKTSWVRFQPEAIDETRPRVVMLAR